MLKAQIEVPQGSILGHLRYILYVRPDIVLYVDNISMITSEIINDDFRAKPNESIGVLIKCFPENNFLFKVKKTQSI